MRKINRYSDVISGILVILFSVAIFAGSASIQQRGGGGVIGPRTMPQIVAALLAILGTGILLSGIKKGKGGARGSGAFPEDRKDVGAVLLTLGLLAAYVSVLSFLGFLIATVLYLFVQLCVLENEWRRHLLRSALIAILTSAGAYFLFRNVFSLMLPAGMLF